MLTETTELTHQTHDIAGNRYGELKPGGIKQLPKSNENPCPHCWLVFYSKGALTFHVNKEHWDVKNTDAA